jgi:hypothetical protein
MLKAKILLSAGFVTIAAFLISDIMSATQQLPATYGKAQGLVSSVTTPASTSVFTPTSTTSSGSGSSAVTASTFSDTTQNWAGYVSSGGTYTTISGSWKVPSVIAGSEAIASDATWIGIGGDTTDDLIQVGTQNVAENGQVTSGTFYEQLPDTSQSISSVNVSAGDTVTASIKEVADGEWSITIQDVTNGESYTNTVAYNSSESSAEWIEEAPSDGDGIVPLDEFGSVTFTGGSTTENGSLVSIAGSNARPVTMDNEERQTLTAVSALNSIGDGFVVTRTDASSDNVEASGYDVVPGGWTRHEPGISGYMGRGYGHHSWPQNSYTSPSAYTER